MSTFGRPRVISCSTDFPKHIGFPRGSMEQLEELLKSNGIDIEAQDERYAGTPIEASFAGVLRPLQEQAANELLQHDIGVLSAATAFGKTVVAAYCIASRRVNTLVLVHRAQLLDQWTERLASFLNLGSKALQGKFPPEWVEEAGTKRKRRFDLKSTYGRQGQPATK